MKKILQYGLFALLSSSFIDAHASNASTHPLNTDVRSAPQLTEVSHTVDVATMLRNAEPITTALVMFRNNVRNIHPVNLLPLLQDVNSIAPGLLTYRNLIYTVPFPNLKNFYSDIQNLTEEQVLELVDGLKKEASKIESDSYPYGYKYLFQSDILVREMRFLAESVQSTSLLSKLSEAYKTLSTIDDSDKGARDILYKFARAVKGQNYYDTLHRLLAALPLIYSEKAEYMEKAPSLTALIRVVCGLCCSGSKPSSLLWDSRGINDKWVLFQINPLKKDALEKYKPHDSPFDPCGVRFLDAIKWFQINPLTKYALEKYKLHDSPFDPCGVSFLGAINWNGSDAMKIAKILAKEGIIQSVTIESTNDESPIPLELTNHIGSVILRGMTMSDKLVEWLLGFKGVNTFEIDGIQGGLDKFIRFFQSSKCNIESIHYRTRNESPNLLQCILDSQYRNSLESLNFTHHFLITNKDAIKGITAAIDKLAETCATTSLQLTTVKAEELPAILRIWNTTFGRSKIKYLDFSSDEWDRLQKDKNFRDLLFSFKNVRYILRKGKSLDSLKEITPHFPANLEGLTLIVESEELTSEKICVITNSVLEYCHNLGSITWLNASRCEVRTMFSSCHAILSPSFAKKWCKDDKEFVLDLLNYFKPNDPLDWQTAPGELAKYPLILEKLISNSRDFRTKYAQIYTELWKTNHSNPGLIPLNNKNAKYIAFLSDKLLPQLAQRFNTIREVFYAQLPQREKMEQTRKEILSWMQGAETEFNTVTDDILVSIRALIAEESNASLIEQLIQLDESARTQQEWWLKLRQEMYSLLMSQVAQPGADAPKVTENVDKDPSQEPAEKRRKID